MSLIKVTNFTGINPSLDPVKLPDNAAQIAENVRLVAGVLDSYREPAEVYNPGMSAIETIYRFEQASLVDTKYWFTFNADVNVVKGAIAGDVQERTYWTGDGYPKVTDVSLAIGSPPYPTNAYRLGTPAPVTLPVFSVTPPAVPDPVALAETRVYVYTFVTAWGEESPPSEPIGPIELKEGDTVTLTGLQTSPGGNHNVTAKRIYRSASGDSSVEYLFVGEIPAAQTTFEDTVLGQNLGEVLPTIDSAILPDDAKGLTAMANGMMAAFKGYDVYFCEPFKPYSWPVTYMQAVDFPVVGLGAFGSSLVVLTTGNPYVMSGSDPQSVSSEKLAMPYACASKRSICNAFGDVVYASPDGLIAIGQNGTRVLTEQLMTRREWQSYNPSSMLVVVWDDRLFIFYDNGTKAGCLTLDAKQGLVESDVFATAAYNDTVTGSLYLAVDDKIVKWDAQNKLTYLWRSKKFQHPNAINFGWGHVLANGYPVTMRLYGDGVLRATKQVLNNTPFRLPAGYKAKYWEIELEGSNQILEACIAESMEEVKRV